jgi:hypothetical protein
VKKRDLNEDYERSDFEKLACLRSNRCSIVIIQLMAANGLLVTSKTYNNILEFKDIYG